MVGKKETVGPMWKNLQKGMDVEEIIYFGVAPGEKQKLITIVY